MNNLRTAYRILILTDHSVHTVNESIYSIARGLAQHPDCEHVHVVSRGLPENNDFFRAPGEGPVFATEVNDSFQFFDSGKAMRQSPQSVSVTDYDVVFLRLPRVDSMDFFTRIGELIGPERMINRPEGTRVTGSKDFLLKYPDLCPPMEFCNSIAKINAFKKRFPIVLKPLNNSGGKGILRISGNSVFVGHDEFQWDEYLPEIEKGLEKGYLGMKFLKNVSAGDKRVIVVKDEVVAAAIRIPSEGSWLCNASFGATSQQAEPDEDELRIAKRLIPDLNRQGVVLFGFDTLMDDDGHRVLSEINSSCVNGIYPAEVHSGKPVVKRSVELLWEYIKENIKPKNDRK